MAQPVANAPSAALPLPALETLREGYFDAEDALVALAEDQPLLFPPVDLVHWGGLTFALNYRNDPVQNTLRRGAFYEASELASLADLLPEGAHIIDIGANIGNHALFFAARLLARRVVVIEPNPLAMAPLVANVVMNGLQSVICTDLLGIGLSDASDDGFVMARHDRNLGATKMRKARAGDGAVQQRGFTVHAGDDLFADERPDLIKIDVEGMEMQVLAGLAQTIRRCRPLMLVEVMSDNLSAFEDWIKAADYRRLRRWDDGPKNANHLIEPAEGWPATDCRDDN